jgi:hypothetical protein
MRMKRMLKNTADDDGDDHDEYDENAQQLMVRMRRIISLTRRSS